MLVDLFENTRHERYSDMIFSLKSSWFFIISGNVRLTGKYPEPLKVCLYHQLWWVVLPDGRLLVFVTHGCEWSHGQRAQPKLIGISLRLCVCGCVCVCVHACVCGCLWVCMGVFLHEQYWGGQGGGGAGTPPAATCSSAAPSYKSGSLTVSRITGTLDPRAGHYLELQGSAQRTHSLNVSPAAPPRPPLT